MDYFPRNKKRELKLLSYLFSCNLSNFLYYRVSYLFNNFLNNYRICSNCLFGSGLSSLVTASNHASSSSEYEKYLLHFIIVFN